MELQEIFPHFGNYSFYCVDVQGVAVHKSVQKIDVLRYSIKKIDLVHHFCTVSQDSLAGFCGSEEAFLLLVCCYLNHNQSP